MTDSEKHRVLLSRAQQILEANWLGYATKPAPRLYPHQWNWDSGFIAIGYANYHQNKAHLELLSLFRGQWTNGMLPHIVYDPQASGYFPGPEFWQIEKSKYAPRGVRTSGITQAPIHATAALRLCQKARDKDQARDFLKVIYPRLKRLHRYYYSYRDPAGEGLVCIVHPWESGTDNSPVWDEIFRDIAIEGMTLPAYNREDKRFVGADQRPSDRDYDRFVYLLEVLKRHAYNEKKIFQESPFVIQDVLFNSILIRANKDLLRISEILGEDSGRIEDWLSGSEKAMDKLWSEEDGIYYDYDWRNQRRIRVATASGFLPLFAGVPTPERAKKLYSHLNSHCFCRIGESCYALANYDRCADDYSPTNYWRGPIWVNINWMLYHGLKAYGYGEYARYVRNSIIRLVEQSGFYEYFEPFEGKGLGTRNFSWTAALLIDLLSEKRGNLSPQ